LLQEAVRIADGAYVVRVIDAIPSCVVHPGGGVHRNGSYGKWKQYVRWECVNENGDAG
jgi:hypothetical protein